MALEYRNMGISILHLIGSSPTNHIHLKTRLVMMGVVTLLLMAARRTIFFTLNLWMNRRPDTRRIISSSAYCSTTLVISQPKISQQTASNQSPV
jgi:hypothetical protein